MIIVGVGTVLSSYSIIRYALGVLLWVDVLRHSLSTISKRTMVIERSSGNLPIIKRFVRTVMILLSKGLRSLAGLLDAHRLVNHLTHLTTGIKKAYD